MDVQGKERARSPERRCPSGDGALRDVKYEYLQV